MNLRIQLKLVIVNPQMTRIKRHSEIRRPGIRDAILQQHARDPLGCQPVTDLRAFEVDGQDRIAAAGKHDDRSAGVLPLRRVDRHRGPRNVAYVSPRPARDEVIVHRCRSDFRPGGLVRIRGHARPYRDLRMSWGRLPGRRLRAETADAETTQSVTINSFTAFSLQRFLNDARRLACMSKALT